MQTTNCKLKIDWASHEAAKHACFHWHYSGCLPVGKLIKCGVWENDKFIGVVLFGRGANKNLCKPYGLKQTQVCELVRIALREHQTPVSRIMAISIKMMKKFCPELELIISYADPNEGHHGGIYQATNWIYNGKSKDKKFGLYNGKVIHTRTISAWHKKKDPRLKYMTWTIKKGKHRYLFPLKKHMEYLRKEHIAYPKRHEHESNAINIPVNRRRGSTDHVAPMLQKRELL